MTQQTIWMTTENIQINIILMYDNRQSQSLNLEAENPKFLLYLLYEQLNSTLIYN